MKELTSNGVEIYQFPTDDETVADVNTSMNVSAYDFAACSFVWFLFVLHFCCD